eukprot:GILJ01000477.1.p1 GENE.GILJ01000477.1~~GILJ01000477.1.p1  ORF type:complete len:373 (-),score=67.05 GILJ01000477.1:84-1202(-)
MSMLTSRVASWRQVNGALLPAAKGITAAQSNGFHSSQPRSASSVLKMKDYGHRAAVSGVMATVFGCSGFLGGYTVERIAKNGTQIVAPFRCRWYDVKHLKPMGDLGQINLLPFNVKSDSSLVKMMEHSQVVVNLLGKDYVYKGTSMMDIHAEYPARIAKLAKELGIKRFIHVSALGASPDSPSEYLRSKFIGEEMVREAFPGATILRPGSMYGEEDRFLTPLGMCAKMSPFVPLVDGGNARVQPIYVCDVAQAIANSLQLDHSIGNTYELGGPEAYTMKRVVELIYESIRVPAVTVSVPFKAALAVSKVLEVLPFQQLTTQEAVIHQHIDRIVAPNARGITELEVVPVHMERAIIEVLSMYRTGGRYLTPLR